MMVCLYCSQVIIIMATLIPQLMDQLDENIGEDVCLQPQIEPCLNKQNKDRSPPPAKKPMGFSPCSPAPRIPIPKYYTTLCQSPVFNPLAGFHSQKHQFDNIEIPPMYGDQLHSIFSERRPSPLFRKTPCALVTESQIEYEECDESGSNYSSQLKHATKHKRLSQKNKILNKFLRKESTPGTIPNTPATIANTQERSEIVESLHLPQDIQSNKLAIHTDNTTKGLKNLATAVRSIVFSLKKTTYKEVAGMLILRLQTEGSISPNQSKDQQNIKRRVYDALNVLISAGVLKKEGKTVIAHTQQPEKKDPGRIQRLKQLKEQLIEKLQEKKRQIYFKTERFKVLNAKRQAFLALQRRNKSETELPKDKIELPFKGLLFKKQPDSIVVNHTPNQVEIKCRGKTQSLADGDALAVLYFSGHFAVSTTKSN